MGEIKREKRVILLAAVRHYGGNNQIDVAIEEMAELTQALVKTKRSVTDEDIEMFRGNVIEEIADVEIMLAQLRIIFDIDEWLLDTAKASKLNRLAERIEKEEHDDKTSTDNG